ncbi:hypothetical protein BBUWI9123_F0008 (plasmid) [Borreliella burgdorferi WI91-23]|nr:hypothetical protein BBUWI9123_F0008 [Borreliella burgdorferi WI91-23]
MDIDKEMILPMSVFKTNLIIIKSNTSTLKINIINNFL